MRAPFSRMLALLALLLPASPSRAEPSDDADYLGRQLESSLLHRRIDFRAIRQLRGTPPSWQPLSVPPAKVLVINLWSRACKPCLQELPLLGDLVRTHKAQPDVQFLFVADPPDETSPSMVEFFWKQPRFEEPRGARCEGTRIPGGSRDVCVLRSLPATDPAHSEVPLLAGVPDGAMRPLTLLVDRGGVIRHAFAGSLFGRKDELIDAVQRLLKAQTPATSRHAREAARLPAPRP